MSHSQQDADNRIGPSVTSRMREHRCFPQGNSNVSLLTLKLCVTPHRCLPQANSIVSYAHTTPAVNCRSARFSFKRDTHRSGFRENPAAAIGPM